MKKDTLDKIVNLRVTKITQEEWKQEAKISGLNLGDWIRSQVKIGGVSEPKTRKPTPTPMPKKRRHIPVDPELLKQIQGACNNLNQISRWCNTYKADIGTILVGRQLQDLKYILESLLPRSR